MERKALDLGCAAGGFSAGLASAGWTVTGVDIEARTYLHQFIHGDALKLGVDFIRRHQLVVASPPCFFACAYKRRPGHVREAENLIPAFRDLLLEAGVPFVIENVQGARKHLREPVRLCGSSFGLDVRRHRFFEVHGFELEEPDCAHAWQLPRFPPAGNRTNLRSTVEVGVWRIPLDRQKQAMDPAGRCDHMTREELSLAVPPAFGEFIGEAAIDQLG